MKLRFFITIFMVLVLAGLSISAIHFHFFRLERLRLIELNLQQNLTLILNSDLTLTKKEFLKEGERYIEKIIGDDKINMIVAIYNDNGTLLYHNNNAMIFGTPTQVKLPLLEWQDVETKDYLIKYLTVEDPDQKRIVRVGMILNQSLLRWKDLSQRVIVYGMAILGIILLISYFLSRILFRPIQSLADHINLMSTQLGSGDTKDFNVLLKLSTNRFNNDEFATLLRSISVLSAKITESQGTTKKWSALMAHELRTPLTILRNRIDNLATTMPDRSQLADLEEEMARLEKIIGGFLEWAVLESDPSKPEIHAVSIKKRCEYLISSFKQVYVDCRIELKVEIGEDVRLFCNPIHFDQLLTNLVMNGIRYGEGQVSVVCTENSLVVSDQGKGIPLEVLEKLGTPFNHQKSGDHKGFGLGLAWVCTICKKYGWQLNIDQDHRNKIEIQFS